MHNDTTYHTHTVSTALISTFSRVRLHTDRADLLIKNHLSAEEHKAFTDALATLEDTLAEVGEDPNGGHNEKYSYHPLNVGQFIAHLSDGDERYLVVTADQVIGNALDTIAHLHERYAGITEPYGYHGEGVVVFEDLASMEEQEAISLLELLNEQAYDYGHTLSLFHEQMVDRRLAVEVMRDFMLADDVQVTLDSARQLHQEAKLMQGVSVGDDAWYYPELKDSEALKVMRKLHEDAPGLAGVLGYYGPGVRLR